MALTTPVALTAVATGTAISLTSASYTPTAGGIQFVFISATGSINGETISSVSSTHSGTGTWTIVKAETATSTKVSGWVAWAITGSSPGSGTFTANFVAAGTDNELFVCETTGQDPVTPTGGTATGIDATTATTPVLTLSSPPAVDGMTVVCFTGRNVGANPGVPSATDTFSSLGANNHANPCASIIGAYRINSTSTGITPSGMGTVANAGAALVINAAQSSASVQSANPGRAWRNKFKHIQRRQSTDPLLTVTNINLGDDPGTGSDLIVITATVPLADTGAGSDAITETATVPLPAETGSGSDGLTVAATVPLAETGTGTDQVSVNGSIPLIDTGSGSDSISAAATVPLADTGTATDGITVTATVPLSDTGTGTDAIQVGVPTPLPAETGTGTDAVTVSATVPLADTGTATDALTVVVTVSLTDLATAADALAVQALLTLADTGHGTDAVTVQALGAATGRIALNDATGPHISFQAGSGSVARLNDRTAAKAAVTDTTSPHIGIQQGTGPRIGGS